LVRQPNAARQISAASEMLAAFVLNSMAIRLVRDGYPVG
jgi:hypothetical protein